MQRWVVVGTELGKFDKTYGVSRNSRTTFNNFSFCTNKSYSVPIDSEFNMVYLKQVQIFICNNMPVFGICPKVTNNPKQFQTDLIFLMIKEGGGCLEVMYLFNL